MRKGVDGATDGAALQEKGWWLCMAAIGILHLFQVGFRHHKSRCGRPSLLPLVLSQLGHLWRLSPCQLAINDEGRNEF